MQSVAAACVMMQKDEDLLLEAWIVYHAWLFGLHNLSVFDNGSTSPKVHRILERYAGLGMYVERRLTGPEFFAAKGDIVGARMRVLRDSGRYDFLFPLDCDEFLAVRTPLSFTTNREHLHAALWPLRDRPETLGIRDEFLNCPRRPGYYHLINCNKTFYAADSFGQTDHGFHTAGSRYSEDIHPTMLAHVHYHHKSFARIMRDAKRKLRHLGADPDDAETLAGIGHSRHLLRYFQMTEAQYLQSFDQQVHIYQPDFIRRLGVLGITNASLLKGCSNTQRIPRTLLPPEFNPDDYHRANPDLAQSDMDPLLHYSMFGFDEGRRISVPRQPA